MSRSSPLWKELLVSLLIIAVVSSLLLPCIPGAGGECLSHDAVHAYSWGIEKEVVSNPRQSVCCGVPPSKKENVIKLP